MNASEYRAAYLILAHRQPGQVARLVGRLQHPQVRLWVHVDRRADEAEFRRWLHPSEVTFIQPRYRIRWGRYSLVEATLAGLRAIQESGFPYQHALVLSGQDYPLASHDRLLGYLARHAGTSFVHHGPLSEPNNAHLRPRLGQYHLPLPGNRALVYPYASGGSLKRTLNAVLRFSGRYPLPRVLPGGHAPYFGSNWVRLSPAALGWVLGQVDTNPGIERFFRYCAVPDEHIFQTILLNATEAERGPILNTNLTYAHWHRPPDRYHQPLGLADLDALLTSGCWLARKFDEQVDGKILDRLDALT